MTGDIRINDFGNVGDVLEEAMIDVPSNARISYIEVSQRDDEDFIREIIIHWNTEL